MTLPPTWIDSTADVVALPRHGLTYATPEMQAEAETGITPHREKRHRGRNKPTDLSHHWRGKYPTEKDWLMAMLRQHRTAKRIITVTGESEWAIYSRIRANGIEVRLGRKGGVVE